MTFANDQEGECGLSQYSGFLGQPGRYWQEMLAIQRAITGG